MDKEQFWHLNDDGAQTYYAEWATGMIIEDPSDQRCLVDPSHGMIGGGKRLSDLNVLLPARKPKDFVWTWYSECMVQDHVLKLFKKEGFTGFDAKPVKVAYKNKKATLPVPKLWELQITGWGGMAHSESGINELINCKGCGRLKYTHWTEGAKLIDPTTWDGSDFFIVWPMPKYIFVTDRVRNFIVNHKLKGISFEAPSEMKHSPGTTPTLTPGRLSHYFPEARAKKVGAPLGID